MGFGRSLLREGLVVTRRILFADGHGDPERRNEVDQSRLDKIISRFVGEGCSTKDGNLDDELRSYNVKAQSRRQCTD